MMNKPAAILSEEGLRILIEALTGLKSPRNAPNFEVIQQLTQIPEEEDDVDSETVNSFLKDYKASQEETEQPIKKKRVYKKNGKKYHQEEFAALKEFMEDAGPLYLKSIWRHMNDLGIWKNPLKSASTKMVTIMKYFDEIQKSKFGMYEFVTTKKVGESDEA